MTLTLIPVLAWLAACCATAGYPAVTVPVGLLADGQPMAVTLIGRPGGDAALLAQADTFEQATNLRPLPQGL